MRISDDECPSSPVQKRQGRWNITLTGLIDNDKIEETRTQRKRSPSGKARHDPDGEVGTHNGNLLRPLCKEVRLAGSAEEAGSPANKIEVLAQAVVSRRCLNSVRPTDAKLGSGNLRTLRLKAFQVLCKPTGRRHFAEGRSFSLVRHNRLAPFTQRA